MFAALPYGRASAYEPITMGSSNYTGATGDFLAAIQGSNLVLDIE
jgi:hypothetical protein